MKILLLNDNPVVTKLVTLSAQKTDDTVTTTHSVEEAPEGSYDLLVIDDAQYSEESYAELKKKIKFKKSLFICSRENEKIGHFSATMKKPFLPTDLVELFTNLKNNLDVPEEDEAEDSLLDGLDLEGLDDFDMLEDMDDNLIEDDNSINENILDNEEAQKVKALLDETQDEADALTEEVEKEDDMEAEKGLEEMDFDEDLENIDLDEEVDLDLAELGLEDDILAEEELLPEDSVEDEAFEESLQMHDDTSLDDTLNDSLDDNLDDNLDDAEVEPEDEAITEAPLEDDITTPEVSDMDEKVEDMSLDNVEDLEGEDLDEDDFGEDDTPEEDAKLVEDSLEDEAEEVQEDLEPEVTEDVLSETPNNEIDSFASLNSRDLKIALGEADPSDEEQSSVEAVEESSNEESKESNLIDDSIVSEEFEEEVAPTKESQKNKGLESLKRLLSALENEDVAAAMEGAKITINISFEDK
ncbi:Cell division protein FtsK [hydrothermal vent metagenome]|uniref:Cell division protein FtsK n=1 Tax=hydrothermal vent metagenome TaxID=652676 RepID=A0A1W1CDV5_9ZZZZ